MAFSKAKALQEAEKSVSQGKISQAIKQYLEIFQNDPRDVALLNTIGDLCVREKNIPEALKHFRRLAEIYTREGWILKGIAIYKKVAKLDPDPVNPLLKLGDLYLTQGLSREGLQLYAQAIALCQRRNQGDRVLEVIGRIVAADPENALHRTRLAECHEALGHREEAVDAYLDAAEVCLRHGDHGTAEARVESARQLSPSHPRVLLLRSRLAADGEPKIAQPEASASAESQIEVAVEQVSSSPQAPASEPLFPQRQPPSERTAEVNFPGGDIGTPLGSPAAPPEPEWEEGALARGSATTAPGEVATPHGAGSAALPGETPVAVTEPLATAGAPEAAFLPEELDLSQDWEAFSAYQGSSNAAVALPTFNDEESRAESDFYLTSEFLDEAQKVVPAPEEKLRGAPQVAEPRGRLEEERESARPPAEAPPAPIDEAVMTAAPALSAQDGAWSAAPVAASAGPGQGLDLEATLGPAEAGDFLGGLAADLEASWPGLEQPPSPPPPHEMSAATPTGGFGAYLGALLDELGGGASEPTPQETARTHYDLGVSFREMGLLDEAIGEFQKVVKAARDGSVREHFLSACSLLGLCFMEKNLAAVAARWYQRALESPGLDEEGAVALHYDLGVAYEQAGNLEGALIHFLEVYSQSIDYRDVAEKIRLLQRKFS